MNKFLGIALFAGGLLTVSACKKQPAPIKTEKLVKKKKNGPDWISNPYPKDSGMDPRSSICAAGVSNLGLASGNIDMARTDAEMQIKNRIAEQLSTEVGLLQERVNNVMRDVASGKEVGDLSLKNINKNFNKSTIVGMRYLATYMHPNNIDPEKVFVLGCVTVDFANMAKEIRGSMLGAEEARDVLEFKHQENMLRFDAVEKEYLNAREDRLRQKGLLIDSPSQ